MTIPFRRLLAGLTIFIMSLTVLIVGGCFAWFAFVPFQPGSKTETIIEVYRSEKPIEIARDLAEKSIVSDPNDFLWLGRALRKWKHIKAGEYRVSPAMNPIEILNVITSGISVSRPITIREGENIYEIAKSLETQDLGTQANFMKLCRDQNFMKQLGFTSPFPPSLEGYLFPDTYFFNKSMNTQDIIKQMVKRLHSIWDQTHDERAKALGLSKHQVLTLASIIEKETGVPQERPMISSVFHNRLKKRMRLQSDPTTIYGQWENYQGNIRKEDLKRQTPYNTYTVNGLPIGPIGNPGTESILAALNPAQSEFLFFVSHNDGTHEFTKTFAEHNNAVKKFQLDPAAREGKSWRDYKRPQK
jgi:UPF0755 protein